MANTDAETALDNQELNEHADAIRRLGRRVVSDVIEIGRRLTKSKALVAHGEWLSWLDREFGWKEQSARNFMNVAKLAGKTPTVGDLALPLSALYVLAERSTPDEVRNDIIERTQAGERITRDDVFKASREVRQAQRRERAKVFTFTAPATDVERKVTTQYDVSVPPTYVERKVTTQYEFSPRAEALAREADAVHDNVQSVRRILDHVPRDTVARQRRHIKRLVAGLSQEERDKLREIVGLFVKALDT